MITVYGISNCDTVRKARHWLEQHQLDYRFHDFRKDGIDTKLIKQWLQTSDWSALLNRRSRTWCELQDSDKSNLSESKAIKLMVANPSLIKRPVLASSGHIIIGFDQSAYQAQLT